MTDPLQSERLEILSKEELARTLNRLASQILENISDIKKLLVLGIPTRGVQLSEVLVKELLKKTGIDIEKGVIDPTFYRDDLSELGIRLPHSTNIASSLEGPVSYTHLRAHET